MGKLFDRNESIMEDNPAKSHIPKTPDSFQTSPLDLSMKRPFIYPQHSSCSSEIHAENNHDNTILSVLEEVLDSPRIITQPKPEWHYRSLKDLQKNHLPYLAGIGPQRTPIRVTVPIMSIEQIYLGISVVTFDDLPHDSKVIVPGKTYVDNDSISHNNNLGCLRFDKCNPIDHFRSHERTIYSEITPIEHQAGYKEVRVHMFNLYQNQFLTKDLINAKQLHQCKLAFWFAIIRNGQFVAFSKRSYSSIIEEKKMTPRSRVSVLNSSPMSISDPRTQFLIDCDNFDNTDDDNTS